jgi:hypothetical protein
VGSPAPRRHLPPLALQAALSELAYTRAGEAATGGYEVGGLSYSGEPSQWVEVDPPVPGGPIDADRAVDLLSRVRTRSPVLNLLRKDVTSTSLPPSNDAFALGLVVGHADVEAMV